MLDIKKRNIAKILSLVMGATNLVAPMTFLMGCSTEVEVPETPEEEKIELTLDENGVGDWAEFVNKAMTVSVDANGNKTYSITQELDNRGDILGFSGRANYEQVKALIASEDYQGKIYQTGNLKIYFDYVPRNGEGVEITPSILDEIYRHFNVVNISDVNDYGERTPVKFSSGNAQNPDIFDLEQYYMRLESRKLTVPAGVRVTQNVDSVNLLGVSDPYYRSKPRVSDSAKLVEMLNHPLFENAKLDVLRLNGNIKPVMSLFDRENVNGNVTFNKDAYYQGVEHEDISVAGVARFVNRGAYANLRDVNVVADDSAVQVNFSHANMSNVSFDHSVDLSVSASGFDYVNATGTLTFNGMLPKSMTYMNAENVVLNGAKVPETDGTDVTASQIETWTANGAIDNVAGFSKTGTTAGVINKYSGLKKDYDVLKNVFVISQKDFRGDLITMLRLAGMQRVYSS